MYQGLSSVPLMQKRGVLEHCHRTAYAYQHSGKSEEATCPDSPGRAYFIAYFCPRSSAQRTFENAIITVPRAYLSGPLRTNARSWHLRATNCCCLIPPIDFHADEMRRKGKIRTKCCLVLLDSVSCRKTRGLCRAASSLSAKMWVRVASIQEVFESVCVSTLRLVCIYPTRSIGLDDPDSACVSCWGSSRPIRRRYPGGSPSAYCDESGGCNCRMTVRLGCF